MSRAVNLNMHLISRAYVTDKNFNTILKQNSCPNLFNLMSLTINSNMHLISRAYVTDDVIHF